LSGAVLAMFSVSAALADDGGVPDLSEARAGKRTQRFPVLYEHVLLASGGVAAGLAFALVHVDAAPLLLPILYWTTKELFGGPKFSDRHDLGLGPGFLYMFGWPAIAIVVLSSIDSLRPSASPPHWLSGETDLLGISQAVAKSAAFVVVAAFSGMFATFGVATLLGRKAKTRVIEPRA
jgi:hypothetical protein